MTLSTEVRAHSQPVQSSEPNWLVLIEKNGSKRLFFVVQTKSSVFTDDPRDRESIKIKCGKAHFGDLMHAGDNPARFTKATRLEDVMARI